MVERFGYSAADVTLLFIINYVFNFLFAKRIGRFIGQVGERKALMFEYVGLDWGLCRLRFGRDSRMGCGTLCYRSPVFCSSAGNQTYFKKSLTLLIWRLPLVSLSLSTILQLCLFQ